MVTPEHCLSFAICSLKMCCVPVNCPIYVSLCDTLAQQPVWLLWKLSFIYLFIHFYFYFINFFFFLPSALDQISHVVR